MKSEKKGSTNYKPDALGHKGKSFETAKMTSTPGQMFVPKNSSNKKSSSAK